MLYQSAGIENTYNNRITSRAGYSWAREYQDSDMAREYRKDSQMNEYQRDNMAREYRRDSMVREYRREKMMREYEDSSIPQDYEHYRKASFEARARAYQPGYNTGNSRTQGSFVLSRESISNIFKLFAIIVTAAVILGAGLFLVSSVKGNGILSFANNKNNEAEEEIEINTGIPVEELSLNAAI